MRRFFPLLAGLLLACHQPDLALGHKFQLPKNSELTLISSAQVWPSGIRSIGGIEYTIATDSNERVVFISTNSARFQTPEGLSTNSTLEQAQRMGGQNLVYEGGWQYYTCLPSGWCAAFYGIDQKGGSIQVRNPPTNSTKIQFFFKRE